MEGEREKKNVRTSTKIAAFVVVLAITAIAVFVLYPVPLSLYEKVTIVIALIGVTAKLIERVIIDLSDTWDLFHRWRFLRP